MFSAFRLGIGHESDAAMGVAASATVIDCSLSTYSVEILEIARTPSFRSMWMQSRIRSTCRFVSQLEASHRDGSSSSYPLSFKRASRPIRATIFPSAAEIEFFNRIDQKRRLVVPDGGSPDAQNGSRLKKG
jgi:hypothetical protein